MDMNSSGIRLAWLSVELMEDFKKKLSSLSSMYRPI